MTSSCSAAIVRVLLAGRNVAGVIRSQASREPAPVLRDLEVHDLLGHEDGLVFHTWLIWREHHSPAVMLRTVPTYRAVSAPTSSCPHGFRIFLIDLMPLLGNRLAWRVLSGRTYTTNPAAGKRYRARRGTGRRPRGRSIIPSRRMKAGVAAVTYSWLERMSWLPRL